MFLTKRKIIMLVIFFTNGEVKYLNYKTKEDKIIAHKYTYIHHDEIHMIWRNGKRV